MLGPTICHVWIGARVVVVYVVIIDIASGRSTILFRLAPGAVVPSHAHVGVEQTWVISGSFGDDEGMAGPGGYIWRPAGNRHEAYSPDGAVILSLFDAPNDFDDAEGWYTED